MGFTKEFPTLTSPSLHLPFSLLPPQPSRSPPPLFLRLPPPLSYLSMASAGIAATGAGETGETVWGSKGETSFSVVHGE